MKEACSNCGDTIRSPIIRGKLLYDGTNGRGVILDIGCAEKLFDDGLFKLKKVIDINQYE